MASIHDEYPSILMLNVFLQLEHLKKETGTFPVLGGRHAQICGQKRLGGTTVYLFSEKNIKNNILISNFAAIV